VLFGERRVQALCDLAETCLSLGDHAAAVTRCEEALVLDPALERAHRVAMLAHYARGDEERALLAYERCRSALVEALGTTPTLQTAALHAAILRREDARSLTDGDAATVDTEHGPPTRYAHLGEVALAYQTIGDGPRDLVVIPGFVSHIEAAWEEPLYASFLRRLAQHQRVTVFDKRGTGLSDPVVDWPSFEERSEEVFAVMDAVGAERFVVLGVSEGAPLGAAAAAISPGRVAGLILYGSWLPHTWEPDLLALYSAGFEAAWTTGNGLQGVNPSRAHDRAYLRRFARYLRLSASPAAARRLLLMNAEIDVDPVLGAVATPTLVLHRRDERWVAIESGRYMADHIADARFVELPGVDHHPWVGDVEAVHAAVEGFIRELDAVGR
jgi:pimeloyl-ACP methyl ester carboxylesterase